MKRIRVVGFDPSLRNWGMASGWFYPDNGDLQIQKVDVTQPVLSTSKQVRQNSDDLESAFQLYKAAKDFAFDAQAVFVEVPVGSQSARAMASYGICIGVLGGLRAAGIPFFELTPTEVKMAAVGSKTATKQQMIDWAVKTQPQANWPGYTKNGERLISAAKGEHMADAIAAIQAGVNSVPFQQLLPFITVTDNLQQATQTKELLQC